MTIRGIRLLIRVQSITDVITNSSSEILLCKNTLGLSTEDLIDCIYDYHKRHTNWSDEIINNPKEKIKWDIPTGMGGDFSVITYKEAVEDGWLSYYFKDLPDPENYLLVDTDWDHQATITWLQQTLNAKYCE